MSQATYHPSLCPHGWPLGRPCLRCAAVRGEQHCSHGLPRGQCETCQTVLAAAKMYAEGRRMMDEAGVVLGLGRA